MQLTLRAKPRLFHYPLFTIPYPLPKPGAHDRNRTGDLVLTKDVLYRLSYVGRQTSRRLPIARRIGAGDGNRTHAISLEG